jgi:prepilin-type N-terminal cleavage/methylation domain-containing protein
MEKSFTLVELLIVIGIITILSSISFPFYRNAQKQYILESEAQKLAQEIRKVEEMGMSAKEITNPNNPSEKFVPSGGYGIYFSLVPQRIIIFADCDDSHTYTRAPPPVCGTSPPRFFERIEDLNLDPRVRLAHLSPSSPLNIVFKPPDPTVFIDGTSSATITISLGSDPSKTKKIIINKAGLIYVE